MWLEFADIDSFDFVLMEFVEVWIEHVGDTGSLTFLEVYADVREFEDVLRHCSWTPIGDSDKFISIARHCNIRSNISFAALGTKTFGLLALWILIKGNKLLILQNFKALILDIS